MRNKISLLISGKLGFNLLVYLFEVSEIKLIATDKSSIQIINFAKENNIKLFVGNPRKGKLTSFINEFDCEILLSINYLFLIEMDIIKRFKFPINFHGSLLPKYRGRTPHVWAIINNEIETGITAHFIDEGCDTGDIILQQVINITENDTGFTILEKYFLAYPNLVKKVLELIENKSFKRIKQNNKIATIYGKRTPDDGHINWQWQKERIRNWVRAQAFPYPGAFAFYENSKVIIDKVSICEVGYNNTVPNGTILQVKPYLVIKTSNGLLKIDLIRENKLKFIQNKVLK